MTARFLPLVIALAVAAIGVLPPFLVGASGAQIGMSLGIDHAQIGIAAASAFGASAVVSRASGRWVQREGAHRALAVAAALSTASLTCIATSPQFAILIVGMCVSGLANSIAQPAANLLISQVVAFRRLGFAIGVKQSSIPLATLLCGIVVPLMVYPLGWRLTFGSFSLLTLAIALTAWFSRPARLSAAASGVGSRVVPLHARPPQPRSALVLLTCGACVATAASAALGVFFVDAGMSAGLSGAQASALLAVCSVVGLTIRVALGVLADAFPQLNTMAMIAVLLVVGAVGYTLLAQGIAAVFVIGGFVAYGAGWTWAGLAHLTAVRDSSGGAAAATGVVQIGISLGGAIGPLSLGYIVKGFSYETAWMVATVATVAAAIVVAVPIVTSARRARASRSR